MKKTCFTLLPLVALAQPAWAQDSSTPTPHDIVVVATGVGQARSQTGQAVTSIGRAEIEQRQTVSIADLLATTPGVTVTRNGGPGSVTSLRIRGAEGDQTLVLVDGVRVNDPSAPGGGFDFGSLLADTVTHIEVLRGPNAIVWGSQALGGVVNLTTLDPRQGSYLRASGEYGWRNSGRATAFGGVAFGPARLSVGGGWYRTDGVSQAAVGTERDGYEHFGAQAKLAIDLADNVGIDLRGSYDRGHIDNDGFPPPLYSFSDTTEFTRQRTLTGYVGLHADLFGGAFRNRIAYTRADIDRENRDPTLTPSVTFASQGGSERLEYQGDVKAAQWVDVVFGAESERTTLYTIAPSPFFTATPSTADTRINSVYGELLLRPVTGLSINAGLRHDQHRRFGGHDSVAVNAAYVIGATGTTLRASYAEGFKAPTLYQLFGDYGTRSLQPETAKSYDAGVEQALGKIGHVGLTWFHRDTSNQIDFRSCAVALVANPASVCFNRPFGTYDNVAKARAEGLEAEVTLQPTDSLTVEGSYSLISTRNRALGTANYGNRLARRPVDSGSVSVDWKSPFGVSVGGTMQVVGDSFDNAANTVKLKGYTLVALRAELPIGDRFSVYGRIENLFDEKYQTTAGYGTPGRGAFAGVRVKLD